MKRIYALTLILSACAAIYSCTKDPELERGEAVYSNVYQTAEEAIAAADEMYRRGAPAFYGECSVSDVPAAMIGGYLSGYFVCESDTDMALYESCRNLSLSDGAISGYAKKVWDEAYSVIGVCDNLITNIPHTSVLTDVQKSQIVAEARFFRAFNYFYLVRTFGSIPIVSQYDSATANGISKVYEFIVDDLTLASDKLSDKAFTDNNGSRVGHPAALTLLADVYLTMSGWPMRQECYAQAADVARQVIQGNSHTLLSNGATPDASAWNQLKTQGDNTECIYSYKVQNSGLSLSSFSLPKEAAGWGVVKTGTVGAAYTPSENFMAIYDNYIDTRSQEQQFFHSFVNYQKDGRTTIRTFQPKPYWWFDREEMFETGVSSRDVAIYRYPEVLLIAAEAIAMTEGVTSEAVNYLADVRARAWSKIDRSTIYSELMSLSADKFVEEVWVERLREFPLEMKIWPDIQRTRKYPVTAPDNAGVATFVDVIGTSNLSGKSFGGQHLLLPVPQE